METFDAWMADMESLLVTMNLGPEFVQTYNHKELWQELYQYGYSPEDAMAEEMSYWSE